MGGWLLAVCAAAFWGGILLAADLHPGVGVGPATALLGLGLAGLAAGVVRSRAGPPGSSRGGTAPSGPSSRGGGSAGTLLACVACFVSLGTGWASLRLDRQDSSPLSRLAGRVVRLEGSMASDPKPGNLGWTASLRVGRLVMTRAGRPAAAYRLHEGVWAEGRGRPPPVEAGDRVVVEGGLRRPEGDFGAYLVRRGYPAIVAVELLRRTGPPASPVLRAAAAVRHTLRDSLARVFPGREAGLLMGLTLGDTSRLDPGVQEDFRATGLSHLTAVSGENVAMFLAPVLGLAMLLRVGRRGRFAVGLLAVVFFVLLTRGEPSVLRAAVMAGLAMLGIFLGRPRSPPAIMGGAVLVLLAVDPTLVSSIGFQLSVAATAGMALLATPLADRLTVLGRPLALAAGTTLAAQAGVTPVILYHFGAVPTVTLPANLLAFPAVSPGMLLGLAAAAIGIASPALGRLVALPARLPLGYLIALADRLARSPLPWIASATGSAMGLVLGLVGVGAGAWWLRSGRRLSRRGAVACGVAFCLFALSGAAGAGPPSGLAATFFDVGQGDAALLRSPGGATILIDGGPDPDLVATKLVALGIRRIDLMVATHPHADHVAGLPAVLARFPVALVVDPGCGGDSPFYAELLRAVRAARVAFRHPHAGMTLHVGDVDLQVLGPARCFDGTDSDPNNDSTVLRVVDGDAAILFPGDAEQPAQQDLLDAERPLLAAAVLKVPHHGGATSLRAFFRAIGARVAVVSVGPNRYGHPVASVLRELARDGMRVLRTDRLGDVTVVFGQEGRGGMTIESRHG